MLSFLACGYGVAPCGRLSAVVNHQGRPQGSPLQIPMTERFSGDFSLRYASVEMTVVSGLRGGRSHSEQAQRGGIS